jgi:hypothetical protein
VNVACGPSPWFIAIADFNRDGVPDIACGTASFGPPLSDPSLIRVLRGYGDGTFAPAVGFSVAHAELWQMVSGDFDGNGTPDLVYGWSDGKSGGFQEPELILDVTP